MWGCIKSGLHHVSSLGFYSPIDKNTTKSCCMSLFPKENWTRIAGLLGATAVGLGAYGAHGLKNTTPEQKRQYDTANYYHFLHTLALAVVPLSRRPQITGTLMLLGTLLFSGTIYYNIFSGKEHLKRLTPYGGIILIISWLTMI